MISLVRCCIAMVHEHHESFMTHLNASYARLRLVDRCPLTDVLLANQNVSQSSSLDGAGDLDLAFAGADSDWVFATGAKNFFALTRL